MNRRQDSKKETQQLILAAARRQFLKKGVERCTMRSIAKEAGVSPASVIVHFKNKTALLEAALNEDILQNIEQAMISFPHESDLLTKLLHIPRAMFSFYDSNRDLYRILVRETVFALEEDTPHSTREIDEYLLFLAELIERAKQNGAVRPETDPQTAAFSLASLYFGTVIQLFRDPAMTAAMAVEILTAMTRQHLNGIIIQEEKYDNNAQKI